MPDLTATARPGGRGPAGGHGAAWVESPLQLLGAVEAAHAGLLGDQARVRTRRGTAMDATVRALLAGPLPAGLRLAAPVTRFPLRRPSGVWAVGDACSGQVQSVLWRAPVSHGVVLLDDGAATWDVLACLTAQPPRPMVRTRRAPTGARQVLGAQVTRRLLAAAGHGRLTVFTALPTPPSLAAAAVRRGLVLRQHSFDWARGNLDPDVGDAQVVVVGSAMAVDGLVRTDRYLGWVEQVAQGSGAVAYLPHRRERGAALDAVAAVPGVRVVPGALPVEVRLAAGAGLVVHSLPSTPSLTLFDLLGDRLHVHTVPDDWWTEQAPAGFRERTASLTEQVRAAADDGPDLP